MSPRPDIPRHQRAGRARAAFTLVELLVALGIAVAVVAATGVAIHAAFGVWTRLSTGSQALLETTRAMAQMERDLASALPLCGTGLSGDADSCAIPRLDFRPDRMPGHPVLVRWSYDAATSTVLREEMSLENADSSPPLMDRFESVPSLRFEYAGRGPDAADIATWQEAWSPPGPTNLPAVVRVSMGNASRLLPCKGVRP